MTLGDSLLVVATSATASGLATYILKTYFEHLLNRRLQIELERSKSAFAEHAERLKVALDIQLNEQKELAHKRLEVYPGIVELAYRIRNMARDACSDVIDADTMFASSFATKVLELENTLFKNKYYFDQDGVTKKIHDFKNCAVMFNVVLGDIVHLKAAGDGGGVRAKRSEATVVYRRIDDLQASLNRKIMAVMSSPKPLVPTKV